MESGKDRPAESAATPRGYGGIRITAPPGRESTGPSTPQQPKVGTIDESGHLVLGSGTQARILTGSALFGVILIVLLHELGHWIAGFAITGETPDFLGVAVRQKVNEFSAVGGVLTWGMGPLVHTVVLWGMVLLAHQKGRSSPRLIAMAGGAAVFSIVVNLFIWIAATFTQQSEWGNDIPRVATFFSSAPRIWMHMLSAGMMVVILAATLRWWRIVLATGRPGLHATPTLVGAFEGAVLVVIATFFIGLWN